VTRRDFLAGCIILPGQPREDCSWTPPAFVGRGTERRWTGWPVNARVSGWHRLETYMAGDEAWWWDAPLGIWRSSPLGFSAMDASPAEMRNAETRYLGPVPGLE
jgi:hypothetical protein